MQSNTGRIDRILRGVLGAATLAVAFMLSSIVLAALAFVPLLTGATGFCPLYALVGLDSGCRKNNA